MSLIAHYDNLYEQSIEDIRNGNNRIDRLIDDHHDKRRGLTLLIRPNKALKEAIGCFQRELMDIDKEQYYQPATDMHVTVLSIISCYDGFELHDVNTAEYIRVIEESAKNIADIHLHFRGVSTSSEAVIIQGFPLTDDLEQFRNQLRKNFKASGLQQTIDARYTLSTAHITAVRFRKKLMAPERFAEVLERYRDTEFGNFRPRQIEFVYNDWYHKANTVRKLHAARG